MSMQRQVEARREALVVRHVAEHGRDGHEQQQLVAAATARASACWRSSRSRRRSRSAARRAVTPSTVRACALRSVKIRNESVAIVRISRPPIVGVPCLTRWPAGPSSRMFWPSERSRRNEMNAPPQSTVRNVREHACAEHVGHSATSASRSRPAEREPLSSTQSPGRSTRASSAGGLARRPAAQCHSQPVGAPSRSRRASSPTPITTSMPRPAQARADLGVPARRLGAELGHVAEHRDGARARRRARRARPARSRPRRDWRCRRR